MSEYCVVSQISADIIQINFFLLFKYNDINIIFQIDRRMKPILPLLLVSLLVFSSATTSKADCPLPYSQQSHIFSDSIGLNSQNNNNKTNAQNLIYSYQFIDQFSSVPNVVVGLNQIAASQSPYLQILVSNARTTERGVYFQAKSGQESKWKNFKINFIASTRTDIQFGQAVVYDPARSNQNTFEVKYPIKQNFTSSGLKVKSFLQGISLQSQDRQSIGVRHETTYITSQTAYFTFSSPKRTSIIHQLSISIIVYNIHTPGLLYADGTIDQNYVVSKTQITIPKHGINELRTYIVGINSFQTSAAQSISISSAIDETFRLIIGPIDRNQINFISVSYLILSVVDCGSCSGHALLFDGLCKITCPSGTKQKNGICVPIDCVNGYVLYNGQCIPQCHKNQYYDKVTGRCFCVDGYYLIEGQCQTCPEAYYFDFKQRKCVPYCTYNSYYNPRDGKCYCEQGYYIIHGICQQCNYGTYYNSATQTCINICKTTENYSPSGCICQNGYYRINGVCSRCPYGQIWNPEFNQCTCPRGQEFVSGNSCKQICGLNERRIGITCECIQGYQIIDGKCGLCPLYSNYSPAFGKCVCENRYTLVNGQCVILCPSHQYLDKNTKTCIDYCTNYGEVFINNKCVCDKGFEVFQGKCVAKCNDLQVRDPQGGCQCVAGYAKNSYGQCRYINCPTGTTWNAAYQDCISICKVFEVYVNGYCTCGAGYQKDNAYGNCIPDCGINQIRVNGFCQCAPQYKTVGGGFCILDCAPGSTNINGMCVCKANCGSNGDPYCPYGQTYNPLIRSCRCTSPKIWVLGQCDTQHSCGPNQYWCGSYCACNNGYFKINGTCQRVPYARQCPFNSISNGVTCLCSPGFYPVIPGVCRPCPTGQIWIGSKCANQSCQHGFTYDKLTQNCYPPRPLCNNNQEWDGANCRCKQGYFWINFKCENCPYGTFFDGLKCSQGTGHRCSDPYALWNGYKCVCIPGYYPLNNDKCVTCPKHTYWDGSCCKPENGYYTDQVTY